MNQLSIFNFIDEKIILTDMDYIKLNSPLTKEEIQERLNILVNFINTTEFKESILIHDVYFLHPNIKLDIEFSEVSVILNPFEKDRVEFGFRLEPNELGFSFSLSYSSNDFRVGHFGGSSPLKKESINVDDLDFAIKSNVKLYQERLDYYKNTKKNNPDFNEDEQENFEDECFINNSQLQLEI